MRSIALRLFLLLILAAVAVFLVPRLFAASPAATTSASAETTVSPTTTLAQSLATTSTDTFVSTSQAPIPTTVPPISVVFAAGGDLGATDRTADVLQAIGNSNAQFMLALGDLSYNHIKPEAAWCAWAIEQLGASVPMQILVGNHEDDGGPDGLIGNFAECMPDRMSSSGKYGVQYFFDADETVRVIMIAADTRVDGEKYNYEPESDQEQWLIGAIRDARQEGIPWVIVGGHKPCITVGEKRCESGEHLAQLLVDEGVDLVLYGHDHNYQRTHQLSCITVNSFDPACVADESEDLKAGNGTVFVVAGVTGRTGMYKVDENDSEAGYFAAFLGPDNPEAGNGYVEVVATSDELHMRFVGVTSDFSDEFAIRR